MRVKFYMVVCIMLPGITGVALAQPVKNRMEKIKEEKMLFINDYCKFSDDEASKFWPLHDEMQEKLREVKKTMRREIRDVKDKGIENMTDNELKKAFDNRKGYEQKQHDIKWEYNDKFIAVVGVKKTAKYYEGEIAFRKKLLDRLKELKIDGNGNEDDDE